MVGVGSVVVGGGGLGGLTMGVVVAAGGGFVGFIIGVVVVGVGLTMGIFPETASSWVVYCKDDASIFFS